MRTPVRGQGTAGSIKPAASVGTLSADERMIVILMLVLGSAMQAYANSAIEAVLVALLLLIAGIVAVGLVFPGRKPELRAFLLTYAVCVFVGGLAQCYSLVFFNTLQSTVDAPKFLRVISPQPPFATMASVAYRINAPLAVVIWQQVYKVTWWLGFQFGPYTGVMFNALVMGLVGSLTVQIARELFGEDAWRLRRVGTLVASCGLFILFGAVLIRDCFTTFFSTLVLWGIVRWLARPTLRKLLFAAALTGVSVWAMAYLRTEAVMLFALYWLLAFLLWLFKRFDAIRLVVAVIVLCAMLVASPYLAVYLQSAQETQVGEMEGYASLATRTSSEDSLGLRLVVNQPLPIRLILGSGVLLINPIPLWRNFQIGLRDCNWIEGYHGIYQVLVLPLVFAGSLAAFRMFRRDRKRASPLVFLVMYLLMNTASVVATSMEQRHLGQFLAAMIIIATVQDTREMEMQGEQKGIRIRWFVAVYLVHLAWATMKLMVLMT